MKAILLAIAGPEFPSMSTCLNAGVSLLLAENFPSCLTTFLNASFKESTSFLITKLYPDLTVSHLVSLAVLRVLWCMTSCEKSYSCGKIITRGSCSADILLYFPEISEILTIFKILLFIPY